MKREGELGLRASRSGIIRTHPVCVLHKRLAVSGWGGNAGGIERGVRVSTVFRSGDCSERQNCNLGQQTVEGLPDHGQVQENENYSKFDFEFSLCE